MKSPERFYDKKFTIYEFMDEILVHCPGCDKCAYIKPIANENINYLSHRRLTCSSCGFVKKIKPKSILAGNDNKPVDSYFKLSLWLVVKHGDNLLWAYNLRHLKYIESFVNAALRERSPKLDGCSNCSIISRLPLWIKKAGNRENVLSLIKKLIKH